MPGSTVPWCLWYSPFIFIMGIFACTEQIPSPGVKVALDVYCGSRGTLRPVFTTCAAPGPLWVPFPQDKSLFLKDSQPWSLSPQNTWLWVYPQAKQNNVKYWHPDPVVSTSLQCGHAQTEIRLNEADFWEESCYLEHRTLTSVIKASQNCYSNKIPNVYGVRIICEAFT